MRQNDLDLLGRLSCAFGPSGFEDEVRDLIAKEIHPFVDTSFVDPVGNLVASVGEGGDPLILAHMDEVGFMMTKIQEDGSLLFSSIGGIVPDHLNSKRVVIRGKRGKVYGVIGAKPVHFNRGGSEKPKFSDLYIQIGANSKETASEYVSVGDPAVFDTDFHRLDDEKLSFSGKALDNRIGCSLLIRLIQEKILPNATFVFTVQEENGLRGATTYLSQRGCNFGIALDTTTANDLPGVRGAKKVCSFGNGAVVSFIDGATVYQRSLILSIFEECKRCSIPLQTKSLRAGGNEASAVQKCAASSRSVSLSIPCRYIHGPVGIARAEDVDSGFEALALICKNPGGVFFA